MKRREFLKAAGVGLAGTAIAAPAIAQSQPALKWRMPTSWPKSLDTLHGAAEIMCKYVGEMTDGKFEIQPFAAGEIVPGLAIVDAVQNGTVECGHTATYYYFGKDPTFGFGTSVPFGPNARINLSWMTQGGGSEVLNEFFKKYNQIGIPAGNTGCQMGGWYRKEINTVDDLKGLKMRIGGWAGKVLQRLGGVPQQIAAGDIYPALEKGTIDAAEWVGPYDDEKLGFYKVAPHYYAPGWWEGGSILHAMINLDKWNALPKGYQQILEAAGHYAHNWCMAKYDAQNPRALRRLIAGGTKLHVFSTSVLDAAYKATMELHGEVAKENESFRKVNESMTAFSKNAYQWFTVAENPYDQFLMRAMRS